jgi:hypothetical protein
MSAQDAQAAVVAVLGLSALIAKVVIYLMIYFFAAGYGFTKRGVLGFFCLLLSGIPVMLALGALGAILGISIFDGP